MSCPDAQRDQVPRVLHLPNSVAFILRIPRLLVEFDLTSLPVALLSRGRSKFEPCQSRKYDEKK
jgi:hypothetical protein